MRRIWAGGFVIAVGCTGGTRVRVEIAPGTPALIAFRDGTGSWEVPKAFAGGTYASQHYELDVKSDEYEVAAVWLDPISGKAVASELRATPDDATSWYLDESAFAADEALAVNTTAATRGLCLAPNEPLNIQGGVIASGEVAQAGQLSIGDWCTFSARPAWTYQLAVPPGVHDVIVTDLIGGASHRVAITRGMAIDAATTLPPVDLGVDGQPLASQTVTVIDTGIGSDDATPITSELDLHTANGGAQLAYGTDQVASRTHSVPVVPPSLLASTDTQVLTVLVADNGGAQRAASTTRPTETTLLQLLPPPASTIMTGTNVDTASWSGSLNGRVTAVDVYTWESDAGNYTSETVMATTHWLRAHSTTSLAFDLDVPGYDPSWAVNVAQPHTTSLVVRSIEDHVAYSTTQARAVP